MALACRCRRRYHCCGVAGTCPHPLSFLALPPTRTWAPCRTPSVRGTTPGRTEHRPWPTAGRSACPFLPTGLGDAGSPPPAAHASHVRVPPTDGADPPARPGSYLCLRVPQHSVVVGNQDVSFLNLLLLLFLLILFLPLVPEPSGKLRFRELLFHQAAQDSSLWPPHTSYHLGLLTPASCTKASPSPVCVDSAPLFLTTPLPGHSTEGSVVGVQPGPSKPTSTMAAKSSTLTPKPISHPAVVDVDTAPPSRAVLSAPPHRRMSCPPCSRGRGSVTQRCPAKVAACTSAPTSVAPAPPHVIKSSASTSPLSPHRGLLLGGSKQLFFPVLLLPLACPTSVLEPPPPQQAAPVQTPTLTGTPMPWIPHLPPGLSSSRPPQVPEEPFVILQGTSRFWQRTTQ
ncbi:uncharacterized protein [Vulpes vulpes]|uniref:Vegetative cell wall protein gp1-like n=1 Tax=Vulpes vulpes TaxID=9627 RepID=A0ABM4Y3S8_VULVU